MSVGANLERFKTGQEGLGGNGILRASIPDNGDTFAGAWGGDLVGIRRKCEFGNHLLRAFSGGAAAAAPPSTGGKEAR